MKRAVSILGSTGTIGVNTLDVISRQLDRFTVFALTAHSNVDAMFEQCRQWNPVFAVMVEEEAGEELDRRCRTADLDTQVLVGVKALEAVVSDDAVDYVMAGMPQVFFPISPRQKQVSA